jgi:hypothetical protein
MLVSEAVLCLSNKVGVLTNKAYQMAPMLVSDLQSLTGDLRGLYEAVLEIEPSREDLQQAERILREYPRKKRRLALAMAEQVKAWTKQAEGVSSMGGPSCPAQGERVQGGVALSTAQKILEAEEALYERIRFTDKVQAWSDEVRIVEVALAGLPVRLRSLIACRYFGNLPVDEVCDRIAISRPHYYRLRDDALLDFQRTYEILTVEECQQAVV